jgi:hypothetical protein
MLNFCKNFEVHLAYSEGKTAILDFMILKAPFTMNVKLRE